MLLAVLLLLGAGFYKARLGQGFALTSAGDPSPAQAVTDDRSSVADVTRQTVLEPAIDASSQEEALELDPEPGREQVFEPESAAGESVQTVMLEADPAPEGAQEEEPTAFHDAAAGEQEGLTDQLVLDRAAPGSAMDQADGATNPLENSISPGDHVETESVAAESFINESVAMESVAMSAVEAGSVETDTADSAVAVPEEAVVDDDLVETLPADSGPVIDHVLHVEFGFDSAQFTQESKSVLRRALELLDSAEGSSALISGYSDNRGRQQYNLDLSRQRAETVARYLAENGIQRTRLQVEGLGAVKVSANSAEPESLSLYNEWRIVEIRISVPVGP